MKLSFSWRVRKFFGGIVDEFFQYCHSHDNLWWYCCRFDGIFSYFNRLAEDMAFDWRQLLALFNFSGRDYPHRLLNWGASPLLLAFWNATTS